MKLKIGDHYRLPAIVHDLQGRNPARKAVVVAIPAHGRFAVLDVGGMYRECLLIRNGRVMK